MESVENGERIERSVATVRAKLEQRPQAVYTHYCFSFMFRPGNCHRDCGTLHVAKSRAPDHPLIYRSRRLANRATSVQKQNRLAFIKAASLTDLAAANPLKPPGDCFDMPGRDISLAGREGGEDFMHEHSKWL